MATPQSPVPRATASTGVGPTGSKTASTINAIMMPKPLRRFGKPSAWLSYRITRNATPLSIPSRQRSRIRRTAWCARSGKLEASQAGNPGLYHARRFQRSHAGPAVVAIASAA
jgi:hypothetical protein